MIFPFLQHASADLCSEESLGTRWFRYSDANGGMLLSCASPSLFSFFFLFPSDVIYPILLDVWLLSGGIMYCLLGGGAATFFFGREKNLDFLKRLAFLLHKLYHRLSNYRFTN